MQKLGIKDAKRQHAAAKPSLLNSWKPLKLSDQQARKKNWGPQHHQIRQHSRVGTTSEVWLPELPTFADSAKEPSD